MIAIPRPELQRNAVRAARVLSLAHAAVFVGVLVGTGPAVALTAHTGPPLAPKQGLAFVSFADINAGLPGVAKSSGAWGDCDNDGDLDLVLTGETSPSTRMTRVYRNGEGGVFADMNAGLPDMRSAVVAWGDYDCDGDLDLFLAGLDAGETRIGRVYCNDGSGVFTDINAGLPGVSNGSMAWGDYDNDGDLDLLLAGQTASTLTYITCVYRNDRGGVFTEVDAGLPGVVSGSVAWGDYDGDGDLDILLTGITIGSGEGALSCVYRNDGHGVFTDINAGLLGVYGGAADWGDYDSDGDLDILLVGSDPECGATCNTFVGRVYRNDGGAFVDIGAGVLGVASGAVAWGDYDNDGNLDILLVGYVWPDLGADVIPVSQVYRNEGSGTFSDIGAGLEGAWGGDGAWGDYDGDGDLDILLTGDAGGYAGMLPVSHIYRSIGAPANTAPIAPTGLSVQTLGAEVTLSWAASTDAETPAAGLSYNLRVGTTPGGSEIMPAMADATTGQRRVVELGNAQQRTSWTLKVPGGQYYWSVQAVDGAFAGSAFAPEQSFGVIAFTQEGVALAGLKYGSLSWGDYDSDGDLDLLETGTADNGVTSLTRLYRNDGSGAFSDAAVGLPGVYKSSVAWGDYDNDGDVDLALTGYGESGPLSQVYRNEGGGSFVDIDAGLPGVYESSVAWGDYDNDGDLDLALTGRTEANAYVSRLYRNEGVGVFAEVPVALPGVHLGSAAWGDYDNDADLDLVLTGRTGGTTYISKLYRNEGGGGFTEVSAGLPGLEYSSAAWGDYDADGDLDLLLTGYTNAAPWYVARIYRNDGARVFADIAAGLPGVDGGSGAWGDYDNDGDLDVVLTGYTGFERLARVYRNDGGGVFVLGDVLPDGVWGPGAWGDYDNDGDVDLALAGEAATGYVASLYRNEGAPANLPPSPPTGLTAQIAGDQVAFSWEGATDDHTPTPALTYNLRIGTTPGGNEILSGMANGADGYRWVVQLGNAQQRTSWTGKLPPGPYYWSVQAVDGAYAGSAFAGEAVPVLAAVASMEAEPGRVRLTWYVSGDLGLNATVYRRTDTDDWAALAQVAADGSSYLRYEDTAVNPGVRYGYRLGIRDGTAEVFTGEAWVEVPQVRLEFALEGVHPNPSVGGELTVEFTLPTAAPARLEVLDVRGRRVAEETLTATGRHSVTIGRGSHLGPGIYVIRLSQGTNIRTARAAVLR